MKLKFYLAIILFISFCYVKVFSYVTFPSATLKVDKNEITVGDTITAEVDISIPSFAILLQTEDDFVVEGWDVQDFSFEKDIQDEEKYKLNLVITTYDSKLKEIPKIKLFYINKNDFEDDSLLCDKFNFFSNNIPVKINSIVDTYDKDDIFDIKNLKKLKVPIVFYIICVIFIFFVILYIYKSIVCSKIKKSMFVQFSPKEKAIGKINSIFIKNFDNSKISEYYCIVSRALKFFIIDMLKEKEVEMTTTDLMNILSDKNNVLHKYYSDILPLFKEYDNAKYSTTFLDVDKFIEVYMKTKRIIDQIDFDFSKVNLEIK